MPTLKSLIQSICVGIMAIPAKISKKLYRTAGIVMLGSTVIAVASFASAEFGGGVRNVAFANTKDGAPEPSTEDAADEELEEVQLGAGIYTFEGMTVSSQPLGVFSAASLEEDVVLGGEPGKDNREQTNAAELLSGGAEVEAILTEMEMSRVRRESELIKMERRRIAFNMPSFTDEDYQSLLKIVQAEAGNNDLEGRMMVANVILNRVKSGNFPDTVTGVVYSPGQFTPITNGAFASAKVEDLTVEAVERALDGEDNSQGALYFMNRNIAKTSSWFDNNLTYLFSHGGHEFFQ